MSELHDLPQHRVRADGRVHVVHHDDGGRTIYDERGLPDRYVPPSLTWRQWAPMRARERRVGRFEGFALGTVAAALVAVVSACVWSAMHAT